MIIPVRDRTDSLRRAVASALAQTRPPDEILVVDDASTPPVTVAAIGLDDPRIRVLRLDVNRGAAGARMAGVAAARGDIVA
ncbi:MAG: glycosyltransferase family 2 protein, partial [Microvirga sp.]